MKLVSPTYFLMIGSTAKREYELMAERYNLDRCFECGCCSYVCPAKIEVTGYIKTGKIFLARQRKKVPE